MSAMISAELLRLRTVATHRWVALGLLALIAVNAAPFVNGASTTNFRISRYVAEPLACLASSLFRQERTQRSPPWQS